MVSDIVTPTSWMDKMFVLMCNLSSLPRMHPRPLNVAEAFDGQDVRTGEPDPSLIGSDDDSSESSDDSGCMSSDDSATADPPARVKRFRARIPVEEKWYVHSKSRLVHRYDGECHNDIRFLVCGKRLNDAYTLCIEASAWNVLCKSCNRR